MDQQRSITGIIFDFDGTLFRLSIDWEQAADAVEKLKGQTLGERIESLLNDRDPDTLNKLTELEIRAVEDGEPMPGATAALASLRSMHIAIFTRNSRHAVQHALPQIGLPKSTIIVGREDVGHLKPNPEGLVAAMDKIGLQPEKVIVVGDTYHDIEAAHAAGLRVVIVSNPSLEFTPKGADSYIASLSELQTLIEQGV